MADFHGNQNRLCFLRRLFAHLSEFLHAAFSGFQTLIFFLYGGLKQPAPIFPHKPFGIGTSLILGFLQVTSQGWSRAGKSPFDSNPILYYAAVTCFLLYGLVFAFENISSSHPVYPIPKDAGSRNMLQRFMFLTGCVSFASTASFLYPASIRVVVFALILSLVSASALVFWVLQRLVAALKLTRKCIDFFRDKWSSLVGSLDSRFPRKLDGAMISAADIP